MGDDVRYNGWSEIEVRARATTVAHSAVLYSAHSTLQRGHAYNGQGHAWIVGSDGGVSRFVESAATKANVAHLVSGYRDTGTRSNMLLGFTPLHYYNDTQPTWWPTDTGELWRTYANNTSPHTTDGRLFWADVCASWCVRRFDDESEFMELDFGVVEVVDGVANVGRCSCYAYQDTAANTTHTNNSHAAPDDLRAIEFLHGFTKINVNENTETMMFAMKKDVGKGLWIPQLQSTVYSHRTWQSEIDAELDTLQSLQSIGLTQVDLYYSVASAERCIELCAIEAVTNRRPAKACRFDPVAINCYCFTESMLHWHFDSHWKHIQDSQAEWYELKYCDRVRPDEHGKSLIWSKTAEVPATADGWCQGSPAGGGAHALPATPRSQCPLIRVRWICRLRD